MLLFMWPFLDRGRYRHPRKRPIAVGIGLLAIVLALFFGVLGYVAETQRTFFGRTYEFDVYGVPHRVSEHSSDPHQDAGHN
jgi:quinol-cytochrome oxidoreductase complex cytochrome b subunit